MIPFSHGLALADAFGPERAKTFWVDGAGHNNLAQVAQEEYFFVIEQFILAL